MNRVECKQCGTDFNLDPQPYYTNVCPDCLGADDTEQTTGVLQ